MLEEIKTLRPRTTWAVQIEICAVRFAERDVAALKHNWKRHLDPFILGIFSGEPSS